MEKFRVIGSFIAFLILAGISCWATEQSLHLLLPAGWPEILAWGITIAFFVVASFGTKLIIDSLLSQGFIENRRLKLCGGIVLVICFWLFTSMPTNTHTFFYNDKIGSVIIRDIETTNKYLTQIIEKGTPPTRELDSIGTEIFRKIEDERAYIVRQFNGDEPPYKKGNGKKIGEHLNIINQILNSHIIQDPNYNSNNPAILMKYHAEIDKALEDALKDHTISTESVNAARKQRSRLLALNDSIQTHISIGQLMDEEIKQCEAELENGYKTINTNKQFIDFDIESDDRLVYTKENAETRTKRMASVIDVFFVDFLSGKYPASFWYYVILSILVDIAAFIFFDIALKNDEY